MIKELTNRVNADPDYVLPPGFIKFKTDVLTASYAAPPHVRQPSMRAAMEVLDDVFADALGMHILEPTAEYGRAMWAVKPDIFQQNVK